MIDVKKRLELYHELAMAVENFVNDGDDHNAYPNVLKCLKAVQVKPRTKEQLTEELFECMESLYSANTPADRYQVRKKFIELKYEYVDIK